jgi:hypothetical protein
MFELSRDYKKAFELIKKGDRLACFVDYGNGCRDVAANIASAYTRGEINISARGISYIYLFDDQAETSEMFEQQCDRLNVEFFLPLADDMLVVSRDRLEKSVMTVLEAKDALCRRKRAIA